MTKDKSAPKKSPPNHKIIKTKGKSSTEVNTRNKRLLMIFNSFGERQNVFYAVKNLKSLSLDLWAENQAKGWK